MISVSRSSCHRSVPKRILIGVSFAIPASTLCITRRLCKISRVPTSLASKAGKRRMVMVDLSIGIGIPLRGMTLRSYFFLFRAVGLTYTWTEYIPQGHRFNIYEDVGCLLFHYINAYIICINARGMHPWVSWDDTHWRFSRVDRSVSSAGHSP